MWITTNNGLDCVDPFNLRSTSFLHDKERWTRSGEGPVKMTIDREGNIWTFSEITNRLHYFNIKESHCTHFASYEEAHSNLPMSYLTSLLIDRNERLWIGNNSQGLCLFVPSKGAFHDYKADPLDPMTMSSNTVNAIYQDRSGMIWLGTIPAPNDLIPMNQNSSLINFPLTQSAVYLLRRRQLPKIHPIAFGLDQREFLS
jgi:ligand-binding sensor domain-containing protein